MMPELKKKHLLLEGPPIVYLLLERSLEGMRI